MRIASRNFSVEILISLVFNWESTAIDTYMYVDIGRPICVRQQFKGIFWGEGVF